MTLPHGTVTHTSLIASALSRYALPACLTAAAGGMGSRGQWRHTRRSTPATPSSQAAWCPRPHQRLWRRHWQLTSQRQGLDEAQPQLPLLLFSVPGLWRWCALCVLQHWSGPPDLLQPQGPAHSQQPYLRHWRYIGRRRMGRGCIYQCLGF